MAIEIEIDVGVLKSEIKKTYAVVSQEPERDFIFPTGRAWAEDLGYPEELANVPTWAAKEGFATDKLAVKGAQLFALSGCLNCHTYNGSGSHNLGAPDLTAEGAKNRGIKFQIAHLQCPSCVHKGSPMPSFKNLGLPNLTALATFLEASKGAK